MTIPPKLSPCRTIGADRERQSVNGMLWRAGCAWASRGAALYPRDEPPKATRLTHGQRRLPADRIGAAAGACAADARRDQGASEGAGQARAQERRARRALLLRQEPRLLGAPVDRLG